MKNTKNSYAKIQAKALTKRAKELGIEIKHTQALELIASIHGKKNREVRSKLFSNGFTPFEQIPGFSFFSITTDNGDYWAIYINNEEVYVSSNDIGWEWFYGRSYQELSNNMRNVVIDDMEKYFIINVCDRYLIEPEDEEFERELGVNTLFELMQINTEKDGRAGQVVIDGKFYFAWEAFEETKKLLKNYSNATMIEASELVKKCGNDIWDDCKDVYLLGPFDESPLGAVL